MTSDPRMHSPMTSHGMNPAGDTVIRPILQIIAGSFRILSVGQKDHGSRMTAAPVLAGELLQSLKGWMGIWDVAEISNLQGRILCAMYRATGREKSRPESLRTRPCLSQLRCLQRREHVTIQSPRQVIATRPRNSRRSMRVQFQRRLPTVWYA